MLLSRNCDHDQLQHSVAAAVHVRTLEDCLEVEELREAPDKAQRPQAEVAAAQRLQYRCQGARDAACKYDSTTGGQPPRRTTLLCRFRSGRRRGRHVRMEVEQ